MSEVYGWYHIIYTLADGQLLKIEQVTKQPIRTALMFLMYLKEKNLSEKQLIKH